ncbi:MAG: LytR C-terminal domain-containing protein [Acidobacteria bacterium]|nr:LytR C-terminal domain-containing protein [Acidobacteriota bacterium]
MSKGQHAAGDGSFGRSASGAMARGVLLIVAAVVLGIVLLNASDRSPATSISAGTGDATETTPVTGNTTGGTTESTIPIAHDPADVTVLVANGSGVKGAAGKIAEVLNGSNFVTATPVNTKAPVNTSTVYFAPGYEADARAVAALLKPSPVVAPLPTALPVADLAGAQVLAVVAADVAAPSSSSGGSTTTAPKSTSTSTTKRTSTSSTIGSAPTSTP